MNEFERIAMLARIFADAPSPAVTVSIGDDAAVLPEPGATSSLVWTIDAQVDGTHFRRDWLSWQDVGYRSFMAAASDLAAMGAVPVAALSALVLAESIDDEALAAIASGQQEASRAARAPIVGGNLARGTETSITTTLLGRTQHAVLRKGARPGDTLYVAGELGMAAAGLEALRSGASLDSDLEACVAAWRRPKALIDEGRAMAPASSAAIDVSDGLVSDLGHMAEASGVTLVLEETALRAYGSDALRRAAVRLGQDALDLMLAGGEDYALAVTSAVPIAGFSPVGIVEAGSPCVVLRAGNGTRREVALRGFDHFG